MDFRSVTQGSWLKFIDGPMNLIEDGTFGFARSASASVELKNAAKR